MDEQELIKSFYWRLLRRSFIILVRNKKDARGKMRWIHLQPYTLVKKSIKAWRASLQAKFQWVNARRVAQRARDEGTPPHVHISLQCKDFHTHSHTRLLEKHPQQHHQRDKYLAGKKLWRIIIHLFPAAARRLSPAQ
jgi:hypothetical protein